MCVRSSIRIEKLRAAQLSNGRTTSTGDLMAEAPLMNPCRCWPYILKMCPSLEILAGARTPRATIIHGLF